MHSLSQLFVRRICVLGVTAATFVVSAAPAHASVVASAVTIDPTALLTSTTSASPASLLQQLTESDDDISAEASQALMAAANDQDNDLQLIMQETKAQTAAKQALRSQMTVIAPAHRPPG
jgi:dienelactone hydrolase